MSPRRNKPAWRRPAPLDPEHVLRGVATVETWGEQRWWVRHIPAPAAVKTYRCPGCEQEIRPGVPHVVVWPEDGAFGQRGETDRRHWHTACWRARDRRRPTG